MYFHDLIQIYSVYSGLDIHETKLARDLIRRNDAGIYECKGVKSVKIRQGFSQPVFVRGCCRPPLWGFSWRVRKSKLRQHFSQSVMMGQKHLFSDGILTTIHCNFIISPQITKQMSLKLGIKGMNKYSQHQTSILKEFMKSSVHVVLLEKQRAHITAKFLRLQST